MRKRPLPFLILSILTLIALVAFITLISPEGQFQISNFKFQIFYVLFPLIFLFLFFLSSYLLKSNKHGILIASFTVIYLIFRLNDLTHPFFLILLAALFLTVELLVSYRK